MTTVDGALRSTPDGQPVLVDCLTLWLSNHLLAEHDLDAISAELADVLREPRGPWIVVSNEVGLGIVPDNALARLGGEIHPKGYQQFEAIARLREVRAERDRAVVLHERSRTTVAQRFDHIHPELLGPKRGVARSARSPSELQHVVMERWQLVANTRHCGGCHGVRVRDGRRTGCAVDSEMQRHLTRCRSTRHVLKIGRAHV